MVPRRFTLNKGPMKRIVLYIMLISLSACGTTRDAKDELVPHYGYSEETPILVGGEDLNKGPARQREYLEKLTGPNGEEIFYERVGSCCGFETENSPFGGGLLDQYKVTYPGLEVPVILYLNMYDPPKGELLPPEGFILSK